MGEHLARAKELALKEAQTTSVVIKLATLQGLIGECETLQLALADEMRKNERIGTAPKDMSGVVSLAEKRGHHNSQAHDVTGGHEPENNK